MNNKSTVWPVIAIAGLERTGSMWSFNVARKLAGAADIRVEPADVPIYTGEMFAAAAAHLKQPSENVYCIIKVHEKVNIIPGIKIINNRRDIADRLYSFMRFTKKPFSEEMVRNFVSRNTAVDNYYDNWPKENMLIVDYEKLTGDNFGRIEEIAAFMGLSFLGAAVFSAIESELAKDRIKKLTQNIDKQSSAIRNPTIGTAFDPQTGFQTGHVSDYEPGDWRKLLSQEQVCIIERYINT